jgi:hypothetical protein
MWWQPRHGVTPQKRLKSSFIYLANAVNDLRANWATFALVLAPLVIVGALCLLPDALNLQHELAEKFAPGARSVAWLQVQEPYVPLAGEVKPLFPPWMLPVFHITILLLTFMVNLTVLCAIRRNQAGVRHDSVVNETLAVYREAGALAPAFFWIVFLQLVVPGVAVLLLRMDIYVEQRWLALTAYFIEVVIFLLGALAYLWLYFARYALVLDGRHGFHGLLFSRDLMRKRFFRVATRILVFLAVWSGYNSWAAGSFVVVSLILGPVGALTGYLWGTIFLVDLGAITVTYVTAAFFTAAGVRIYQDLIQTADPIITGATEGASAPTIPISSVGA